MGNDETVVTVFSTYLGGGGDDGMRGSFGLGLGVEAAEGEAQRAGGIAGAHAHGFKDM